MIKKRKRRQPARQSPVPEKFENLPFRELGSRLRPAEIPPSEEARVAQPGVSDHELLREAMKDVREIPEFRRLPSRSPRAVLPRKRPGEPDDVHAELEAIVCGSRQITLADTQEYVEWINPRYSRELIRELHHGRFARQDSIDLHGMIRDQAAHVLAEFLANARRRGHRCVKIVHGRGLGSPNGPVIKQSVVEALSGRFRKQVIGFVTASQNDGGLGALYVLLA